MDWKLFFNVFLTNKEIFYEFLDSLDTEIFENAILSNLFKLTRKFYEKHKKQPDFDMLVLLLEKLPDIEKENKQEYLSYIDAITKIKVSLDIDIFKNEVYDNLKRWDIQNIILKTAKNISSVTFDNIVEDIQNVSQKYKQKSLGIDVSDIKRVSSLIQQDTSEKITTGIDSFDTLLGGGVSSGEILIGMAPPGRGKSFFLLNLMYGAMLSKKKVLYLTFELYEKTVLKRLYSRIGYVDRKGMLDEEFLTKAVSKFFTMTKGEGRVCYFPAKSVSVIEIESFMESQKLYFNFEPEILIVDYLDLISPRKNDMKLDIRHRLRSITEDLRALGIKKNIPVLTVTQANRASLDKAMITEAHASEAFGKIETADVVIAICQTAEEKSAKRARLVSLKNRDFSSGGMVEVYVDFERMLLLDLTVAEKMGLLKEQLNI